MAGYCNASSSLADEKSGKDSLAGNIKILTTRTNVIEVKLVEILKEKFGQHLLN